MKRFLVTTVTASLLVISSFTYADSLPQGLRVVSQRKIIIRVIPKEFQTPTDDDSRQAALWLLGQLNDSRSECVKVEKSGDSAIQGVFCLEDILEMLEEY